MKRNLGNSRTRATSLILANRSERLAPWLAAVLISLAVGLVAVALMSLAGCGGGSAMPAAPDGATGDQISGDGSNGGADATGADATGDAGGALPRATSGDFTLTVEEDTYQVLDSVDDIVMTVEDQGETVAVRATILGAVEMYAFVATLDFDPQRFNPVSLLLADMERPELGLQEPNKLPGAREYGRYWLIENRT